MRITSTSHLLQSSETYPVASPVRSTDRTWILSWDFTFRILLFPWSSTVGSSRRSIVSLRSILWATSDTFWLKTPARFLKWFAGKLKKWFTGKLNNWGHGQDTNPLVQGPLALAGSQELTSFVPCNSFKNRFMRHC